MTIALPEAPKRSEAVFRMDYMQPSATGWQRKVTYCYEGDEFHYTLDSLFVSDEEEARRRLYELTVDRDLHSVFLQVVRLDMTRAH